MDYNLNHPKRKKIFGQFLYNEKLRFNEIEKATGIKSNQLAYFLQKLVEEKILEKKGETYGLHKDAEKYIPFFVTNPDELSPLPVVLVAYEHDGRIMLLKREKRPYAGYWGLISGRILLDETIRNCAMRIIKKKAFLEGRFEGVNAIVHERTRTDDRILHAFLLILVTIRGNGAIKEKGNLKWFSLEELGAAKVIPSDLWMIRTKLGKRAKISEEIVDMKGNELVLSVLEAQISQLASMP